jgi:hypothetical protein
MTMATRFLFVESCSVQEQLDVILKKHLASILETQEIAKNARMRRDDVTFFPNGYGQILREYGRFPRNTVILQGIINTDGFIAKGASK